jgi:hypothetical protein
MGSQRQRGWAKLIALIPERVRFFALVVLVLESALGGLAVVDPRNRLALAELFALVLVLVILLVAVTSFYDNRRVTDDDARKSEHLARGLAADILDVFDGSLSERDREVAYPLLNDALRDAPYAQREAEKEFCCIVGETIIRSAKLKGSVKKSVLLRQDNS